MPEIPVIQLPTRRLVVSTSVAGGAVALVLAGVVRVTGLWNGDDYLTAMLWGCLLTTLVALASMLAIIPWRPRAVDAWVTLWMAGAVLRLLSTSLVAFLLYFATPLDGGALAASVVATYLAALGVESVVLSRHLHRVLAS